jgi:hypothetical protein
MSIKLLRFYHILKFVLLYWSWLQTSKSQLCYDCQFFFLLSHYNTLLNSNKTQVFFKNLLFRMILPTNPNCSNSNLTSENGIESILLLHEREHVSLTLAITNFFLEYSCHAYKNILSMWQNYSIYINGIFQSWKPYSPNFV